MKKSYTGGRRARGGQGSVSRDEPFLPRRGGRGSRGAPGAERVPKLPRQALARGAVAPGQWTQPPPERDRGTLLKALQPSTDLALQGRGESGHPSPLTLALLDPASDLGRGSPDTGCQLLLAVWGRCGGYWAGGPSRSPPSPLHPQLEPLTFQAPRFGVIRVRMCRGAEWRISLASRSRLAVWAAASLLQIKSCYPLPNGAGEFRQMGGSHSTRAGNSGSPFGSQDAIGVLAGLAGLTSHRWRRPDPFASCA